jgi:hypothetical protein
MSTKGFLKDKYKDYGASPNDSAWANISGALPAKKKQKGIIIWWLVGSSGIAASLLVGMLFYNFLTKNESDNVQHPIIKQTPTKHKKVDSSIDVYTNDIERTITKPAESFVDLGTNDKTKTEKAEEIAHHSQNQSNLNNYPNLNKVAKNVFEIAENKEINSDRIQNNISKTNPTVNSNLAKQAIKSEIKTMQPRETKLLTTSRNTVLLATNNISENSKSRWQWGAKLGSDFGVNELSSVPFSGPETFTNTDAGLGTTNPDSSVNNQNQYTTEPMIYSRIDKPISFSFLVRFSPIQNFYFEIDPSIAFVRTNNNPDTFWSNNINSPLPNKSTFLSFKSGLNIGYNLVHKKRWVIDIATGFTYQKLLNNYLPVGEGPFHLFGNSIQFGMNYYLTEKASIRLSPEFSWVYGNSQRFFVKQFQNQNSIGLGVSFLRDF